MRLTLDGGYGQNEIRDGISGVNFFPPDALVRFGSSHSESKVLTEEANYFEEVNFIALS